MSVRSTSLSVSQYRARAYFVFHTILPNTPPRPLRRSVADRTHSWRKEKNQQADARRHATVSKELDGCTFQPQINKSSRRAMTISRYGAS